ncbi:hypothetical protein ACH5RR_014796 [Cinchona calisaya]|uniref:Uncharacterized protein n=1 Tax=Cinchona calisaya TaxID=153742 RepID=A0ABD2ZU05_9GENT
MFYDIRKTLDACKIQNQEGISSRAIHCLDVLASCGMDKSPLSAAGVASCLPQYDCILLGNIFESPSKVFDLDKRLTMSTESANNVMYVLGERYWNPITVKGNNNNVFLEILALLLCEYSFLLNVQYVSRSLVAYNQAVMNYKGVRYWDNSIALKLLVGFGYQSNIWQ